MIGKSLQHFLFLFLMIGLLLSQSSCSKKVSGIAPLERYSTTFPKVEESYISIPVEMPIANIQKQLNKNVSGLLYEMKNLSATGQDKFNLKVWKQSDIKLQGKGSDLWISVPLKVRFDGKIGASAFGVEVSQSLSSDFAIRINLISSVSLNPKWKVVTKTQIKDYQWLKKPVLKIGVVNIPLEFVADVLLKSQKKYIAEELDKAIQEQVDIKTPISQAWKELQVPRLISEEYDTWFAVTANEVNMTPFSFANQKLSTTVAMRVNAKALISKTPLVTQVAPLRDLRIFPKLEDKFEISLLAEVDRKYANAEARKQLVGQTYTHKRRKITVTDVYLYGSDDKLVVKLDVEGSLKGAIYLSGKLVYDEAKKALVMADMDFAVDTKNILAKTGVWLFEGKINKKIQESMQIPLNQPIEEAKTTIQKTLKNYPLGNIGVLKGNLNDLKVQEVLMTEKSLWVIIKAKGDLKMELKNF